MAATKRRYANGVRIAAMHVALVLAACEPRVQVHGHAPPEGALEGIRAGLAQNEVSERLGAPSSTATFGDETWYYITRRTETTAFFNPDVQDQAVVAIVFDADGRVREVKRYTLADSAALEPVARTTPTRGREFGLLEQLFGNIGRYTRPERPGP